LVGHHELVLNSIRDAILVISKTGKIISSNAAAIELAELKAGKLPGRSLGELILEHKTSGIVKWAAHFLSEPVKKGETTERIAAFLKKPNGTVVPVRVSCFPTRDHESLTGAVVTIYSGL
jgi:PAS domain S-box-containing protein